MPLRNPDGTINWAGWDEFKPLPSPTDPKPPAPFVPSYERVINAGAITLGAPASTNNLYFPDAATCATLAVKFGASPVITQQVFDPSFVYPPDFPGTDGSGQALAGQPAQQRILTFLIGTPLKNGDGGFAGFVREQFTVAACWLAQQYTNNPEAQWPPTTMVTGAPWIPPGVVIINKPSNAEQGCWALLRGIETSEWQKTHPNE